MILIIYIPNSVYIICFFCGNTSLYIRRDGVSERNAPPYTGKVFPD